MVDKIEMSLDDIIKKNKIGFRRGGASGGGAKKQANGAAGANRRNVGQKSGPKFRGTAKCQIGKPKGRSFGGAPTCKFTRVQLQKRNNNQNCNSHELRGGNLYMGCDCFRRNGLQKDCPRTECRDVKHEFLKTPTPKCCPSKNVLKYVEMTRGIRKPGNEKFSHHY